MKVLKAPGGKTRLKEDIYSQIKTGLLRKNDRIMGEEQLSSRYNLGIKTVRSALNELEEEGLIVRKRRVGTFIKTGNIGDCRNISILEFEMSTATAYHSEIFTGIERCADLYRCSIQINPIRRRSVRDTAAGLLRNLVYGGRIDGLLLLSWLEKDEIESLLAKNIPFVAAGFEYRDLDVPAVACDYRAIMDRAIMELLESGHERIALITGSTGIKNESVIMANEKLTDEFSRLLKQKDLYESSYVKKGLFAERDGFWLMRELIESGSPPDAVISCGNELTNGAMKALYNKNCAGKIKLFPLSDRDTMMPRPQIKLPIDKIGSRGMEMLMDLIEGRELKARRELIDGEMLL